MLPEKEVLKLIKTVDKIYACVGKKVVFFDLNVKESSHENLLKAICRNGKLRAPAIRKGKTLLVGFDDAIYTQVLT